MKMMMKTMVAAVGIAAALTASAMTEAIAYRGRIRPASGAFDRVQQLTMTFKVYGSLAPGKVLWARTIPVRVDTTGNFYVELKDSVGTNPLPGYTDGLALACATAEGDIQIGLTPPNSAELTPRQTLRKYRSAQYAVFASKADRAVFTTEHTVSNVYVKGVANVNGNMEVPEGANMRIHLSRIGNTTVGDMNSTITLHGGINGWKDFDGGSTQSAFNQSERDRLGTASNGQSAYGQNYGKIDNIFEVSATLPYTIFAPAGLPGGVNVSKTQTF